MNKLNALVAQRHLYSCLKRSSSAKRGQHKPTLGCGEEKLVRMKTTSDWTRV